MRLFKSIMPCSCSLTTSVKGYNDIQCADLSWLLFQAAYGTELQISDACCVFTMHLFLIYRYYALSQHTFFSVLLALISLIPFVLVCVISVSVLAVKRQLLDRRILRPLAVWVGYDTEMTRALTTLFA